MDISAFLFLASSAASFCAVLYFEMPAPTNGAAIAAPPPTPNTILPRPAPATLSTPAIIPSFLLSLPLDCCVTLLDFLVNKFPILSWRAGFFFFY